MNQSFLTLRVSRRAIGAAQLSDETLTLADGRHLSSRSDRAVVAGTNFVRKLTELTKPACLIVDSPPRVTGGITDRLMARLEALALELGIPMQTVTKPELLTAYGLHALKNRRELRELVREFWPELSRIRGQVEPYVLDAAAAALYAECRMALNPAGA